VAAPTLRADAARNLELILVAAEESFAEKGHEASVADIAARAGVGQATIFRRFETKDDLIAAVFERKLEQMVEAAEAAARKKRAWDGLTEFMVMVTQLQLRDRGFFQSIAEQLMERKHLVDLKLRAKDAMTALVDRAKAEGDLRPDISPEDIFAFCCAAAQAATMGPNASPSPKAAKRYLSVMTDGMRASAA
jgi:AcrR family transcriptional regulator